MIPITFDSSAVIAATITQHGVSAAALDRVVEHHQLFLSEFVLAEVRRKLISKFSFDAAHARLVDEYLCSASTLVEPIMVPKTACRDPEDLPILGTALAAQAKFLVSVDNDLLSLGEIQGIRIVRPGEFLRLVATLDV